MDSSPLERLKALADQSATQDSLQLVVVKGAEGSGRTHLLEQLAASRANAVRVQCASEGTLGRVLRALLQIEGEDPVAIAAALSESAPLVALDPERRPLVAQLLASLLCPGALGQAAAGLDPGGRSEGACAQLIHVVSFAAATAPLVLGLDDAHLADPEALAFFDALAHLETPVPALIVFTAEPAAGAFLQRHARWPERKRVAISLEPLDGAAIDALLQRRGCTPVLAARLAAVVEGNPKLAIGVWAALARNPGLAERALPATFDALRLESVRVEGPELFAIAQRAAVLGESFLEGALAATGPLDPARTASSPVFQPLGAGPLGPAWRFADPRIPPALRSEVAEDQRTQWLEAASAWAVESLGPAPETFERVLPLALRRLEGDAASRWQEAWAGWLGARGRQADSLEALAAAIRGSQGVRRAVLIRRTAEAQLLAGQPERALATLLAASREAPPATPERAGAAVPLPEGEPDGLLDRWRAATAEEATVAIELVRAEACCQLGRRDEALKGFAEVERLLEPLQSPAASHLWIRWGKSAGGFCCEVLGRPAAALRGFEKVRQRVADPVLKGDGHAVEFLRGQQLACAALGDFGGALALVEELIAHSRSRGDLRAQCLAWGARGLLHFGHGELGGARRSIERSLELARATGWKRREALATHHLALVLVELGELDAAQAAEERYLVLSAPIGNRASAEGPAVLAAVALARGDLSRADLLITQARKAAEANDWMRLLAWARSLAGRLRVQKFALTGDSLELSKARNDFLAALDLFEEHSTAWSEEVDPGEVYALYAAALELAGLNKPAAEALERGERNLPAQHLVSRHALEVGRAFVGGTGMDQALEWFESSGYQRLSRLWRQLAG